MDANFRQVDNPYERLQKREARRREFERMAAARFGAPGQQSANVNQPLPGNQVLPDTHRLPARPSLPMPRAQGQQPVHRAPSHIRMSGPPAVPAHSAAPNVATSNVANNVVNPNVLASRSIAAHNVNVADPHRGQFQGPTEQLPMGVSPPTPPYQIPRPPIPGQSLDQTYSDGKPMFPVPPVGVPTPKDPRALLPDPTSVCQVPSPVIPQPSTHNPLLREPPPVLAPLSAEDSRMVGESEPWSERASGSFNFSSSNAHATQRQGPLLPNPNSLLPSPKGLLPAPDSLLPNPVNKLNTNELMAATQAQHEQFKAVLDENNWNTASTLESPHNQLQQHREWENRKREECGERMEPSHQTMAADSTSAGGML